MSVQSEIDRIKGAVSAVYQELEQLGAAMPEERTVENLSAAAASIPTGGLDTSDATAAPEDMGAGKTAYVNGELVTGTAKIYTSQIGFSNRTPTINGTSLRLKTATVPAAGWLMKAGASMYLDAQLTAVYNAIKVPLYLTASGSFTCDVKAVSVSSLAYETFSKGSINNYTNKSMFAVFPCSFFFVTTSRTVAVDGAAEITELKNGSTRVYQVDADAASVTITVT